ncbi:S-layer homology domain-containing protein [Paenibacillus mesotrionivorans]|uniref:S-layer homology domain-containing protein n=1 Tax=Paenibacillus mesotrionivorans TaxID=3160968 RepID=A0ACC7P535_9BACL
MRRLYSKWISMIVAFCIIATIFPILPMTANAASTPGVPSFFYPSNSNLLATANKDPGSTTDGLANFAYRVTSSNLTITGSFQSVTSDSIKVLVENLVSSGSNTWKVDKQSAKAANATGVTFEIPSLQLFSGYNRITVSGTLNGDTKSDVFYVFYDDAPYLKSLKVIAPGLADPIDLNEGTVRVISKPVNDANYRMFIYLQGIAANATSVTVNSTVTRTTEEGNFVTPQIELKPGENTITMSINNGSDNVGISRKVYYYDPESPFLDIQMKHIAGTVTEGPSTLLGTQPPYFTAGTDGINSAGELKVSMLVPYKTILSTADFINPAYTTATAQFSGSTTSQPLTLDIAGLAAGEEQKIIYDSLGNPEFVSMTFNVKGLVIPGTAKGVQSFTLNLQYKNGSKAFGVLSSALAFNIYRGNTVVNKVELLETNGNTYGNSLGELNGKEVLDSSFYVRVTADKSIGTASLKATLLPLGITALTVDTAIDTTDPTQKIYKISGLPAGAQQIQFWFDSSDSRYVASVNYVTKIYIQVAGIYDQQVINVDSSSNAPTDSVATITFNGFNSIVDAGYILNGTSKAFATLTGGNTASVTLSVNSTAADANKLMYGENVFTVRGYNRVGSETVLIEKVIRLYVIDSNQPGFTQFKPLDPIGMGSSVPSLSDALTAPLKQIMYDKALDKYTTKAKDYGIIFQGSGAVKATVLRNGERFAEFTLTDSAITNTSAGSVTADFTGNSKSFTIRIRNLSINSTNTDTYSVELMNRPGAKSIRKLDIARQLSDVVYWAPVPTVGDRIVVNKNFVQFDIEAEGATSVLVDGVTATPRQGLADRYVYTYNGLKANKETKIKVTINRASGVKTDSISVFYTGTVQVGSQYMEQLTSKHSMFGGSVQLAFEKGTVLKTAKPGPLETVKYYDKQKLLFGIADPIDGVVERMNDYGQLTAYANTSENKGPLIPVHPSMKALFTEQYQTLKFTSISPVYWISGGLGESSSTSVGGAKPAVDGIQPYLELGGFAQNVLYGGNRKIIPSKSGTITLKFDDNLVSEAGTIVTVFRMTDNGIWTNIGGAVNVKDNTITAKFDDFGYYKVMKLRESFNDVTNHAWARNTIDALFSKGIMRRINFDQFGVDNYITRGEFAALMVRALQLPINSDSNFTFYDVPNTGDLDLYGPMELWKYAEIETAARSGIVSGTQDRYFDVNGRITRQDAAVMIARAMELKLPANDSANSTTKKLLNSLEKLFTDAANIQYYARPSVSAVNSNGIMEGRPNALLEGEKKPTASFVPEANLTRAEAATIVLRVMKKKTKVFPANFN